MTRLVTGAGAGEDDAVGVLHTAQYSEFNNWANIGSDGIL